MCLLIDANSFAAVFQTSNARHADFAPVRECVQKGIGRLVFGGSTYGQEIGRMTKFLNVLKELERARKIRRIEDQKVDGEEKRIRKLCDAADFNDAHLVALAYVSRCPVVCTQDQPAMRYLRDARFYDHGRDRPSIYSQLGNESLLKTRRFRAKCES